MMDFIQDNWKRRGTRPVDKQWTGKTFFRVFGPYESDYKVESSEVRETLTDFEFVGQEKMGDYLRAAAPAADPGKGTKQLLAPFSWQGNTMPLKDGEAPKLHPENA